MSGHGANPIFFNKRNKDWTSITFSNLSLPTSDNISFLPYPPFPWCIPFSRSLSFQWKPLYGVRHQDILEQSIF